MADAEIHGGREIVAPQTRVGSGRVADQGLILSSDDAEYHRHQDLLQGYFEKFTRWQEIFIDEKYRLSNSPKHFGFRVAQTPEGLTIGTTYEGEDLFFFDPSKARKDTVIYAEMLHMHIPPDEKGEYGLKDTNLHFSHGMAGGQLFVDPDGKPLISAEIIISSVRSDTYRDVIIIACPRPKESPDLDIKFRLQDGTLTVSKFAPGRLPNRVLIPENYATTLLNTIDALIPGTPATPQPERRTSERAIPKLPAPRRKLGR